MCSELRRRQSRWAVLQVSSPLSRIMKVRNSIVVGVISLAACTGLEFVAYPWSVYYRNFHFGFGITLQSYLLLSGFVGLISALVGYFRPANISRHAALYGCATGLTLFSLLCFASAIFGPLGFDPPGVRLRGIFFSEWKFDNFDLYVALPVSVLNGLLLGWWARRRSP